jgi:hypothetical protein
MDGIRAVLWKSGAVGPLAEVQARSWLQLEVERTAQIAAFQDILLLLALLQIVALFPTLLIRSGPKGDISRPAKAEEG